ncbi:E3 SUMO-protein ligase ZBED1-like [Diprion similis]|uniref:E3 SUMO-protein ligase ZBED1-like n=1 Tax=Diprion similis TaxID=362088 RepID=UPI001EF9574D|nr:E3 SUMO-protein ligase ZBED1-like [Diprion similis]
MKKVAPLYHIPSRKINTKLIEQKYQVLSNLVKIQLSGIDHLTLTTDVWTDTLNTKSFLGITAHFVSEGELVSIVIGVTELNERHTAENLGWWLLKITSDWNIKNESILAIVTDNASNITKAITDVFGSDKQLPCFVDTLNLVASRIIEGEENVKSLCAAVKAIVTYFKHSVVASDRLQEQSDENLKLIQSVPTRWNSTYYMLERFIHLSEKIGAILLQFPTAPAMLTAAELQTAKEFVKLLQPLEQATKIACGQDYITGSNVIPIVDMVKKQFENCNPITETGRHMKNILLAQFHKRFENIESVSLLAISTILDPRFKRLHFSNRIACAHAVDKITKKLNDMTNFELSQPSTSANKESDSSAGNFWSERQRLIDLENSRQVDRLDEMPDEFRIYLNQTVLGINESPIKYWIQAKGTALSSLANQYLPVIATSVPSERLFSEAGNIMCEARNRLTGEHLQHLLFLKSLSADKWHND